MDGDGSHSQNSLVRAAGRFSNYRLVGGVSESSRNSGGHRCIVKQGYLVYLCKLEIQEKAVMKTLFHPDLEKLFRVIGLYLLKSEETLEAILEASEEDIRIGIAEVESSIATYFQQFGDITDMSDKKINMGSLWALLQDDGRTGYEKSIAVVRKVFAELVVQKPHPKFIQAQLTEVGFEELMIIPVAVGFHSAVTSPTWREN